jgi:glycerophosphoryl diester phosphodiesterase
MSLRISLLLISTLFLLDSHSLASGAGDIDLTSSDVLIAAHRGGYESDTADRAPENSVANIRNCQSKGYELYETDIQRTKDGHFVMMHDATIDRETTGTGKASDMDLAELKKLHKRYRDGSVSEERVATLEEFLVEGKGRTIFKADLKPGVSAHFKEIMQLVVKHDAMDGIIFRVPYEEVDLFAQYVAAGGPYSKNLLMFKTSGKKQVDDIVARFDPLTIQINISKSEPTNPETLELVRYATGRGLMVEAHAEGSPDDWAKLIDAGVRMFHTKKPAEMGHFLHSREEQN